MSFDVPIMRAIGFTGSLEVYKDRVLIAQSNTRIPLREISYGEIDNIQIITAYNGGHPAGFIRIKIRGEAAIPDRPTAIRPECIVYFRIKDESQFAKAKQYMLQRMEELNDNKGDFRAGRNENNL
jgi:hypothetical protein